MRTAVVAFGAAALLAALPALAQPRANLYAAAAAAEAKPLSQPQRLERRFLQIAAANLRFQSEASRLAATRSNNPAVKDLANALLARQQTAQPELLRLLHARGMAMPIPTNEHGKVLKQLAKLNGAKFDRLYVDEVVIGCRSEVIARHPRCYAREEVVFDPLHYLPLIEQKINAFDQAAPLQGWDLPEAFTTLQRLMEGRMHKHGRREYVQVLRLLETFTLADLQAAVEQAIDLGAIGFDAVKHLVLCRIERVPPRLDLDVYPFLPRTTVEKTFARAYLSLLSDRQEAA